MQKIFYEFLSWSSAKNVRNSKIIQLVMKREVKQVVRSLALFEFWKPRFGVRVNIQTVISIINVPKTLFHDAILRFPMSFYPLWSDLVDQLIKLNR